MGKVLAAVVVVAAVALAVERYAAALGIDGFGLDRVRRILRHAAALALGLVLAWMFLPFVAPLAASFGLPGLAVVAFGGFTLYGESRNLLQSLGLLPGDGTGEGVPECDFEGTEGGWNICTGGQGE